MRRKYILTVSVLSMIMIFLAGCKREKFIWGTKIGDITYSEEVVLLGAEELDILSEVTNNEIVFSATTAEIGKLSDINFIVAGITEKTPYGLLRKVIGIQNNGTSVTIATTDATLTDIIKEGTVVLKMKLLEKDFKLKSKMDGVLVTGPGKAFDGLAVTLDNLEIFKDGTKLARLNGSIGVSPEIDLKINIKSNKITEIKSVITLNKIDELTFTSNGPLSGVKEIVAAEFVHSPIIVDSLVIVPEVKIICGFDGTTLSEVTSGVRQDRIITSELNYANSVWSESPLTSSESHDFTVPQVTDNSELKIFSGPEITLNLFGIPVQTVKATGYYSLLAQKTASPFWRLLIGSDGQNSVKSDILGLSADFNSNMIIQASEIANANGRK